MISGDRGSFAAYKVDGRVWITLASADYYPDYLLEAVELYKPVFVMFGRLLRTSESSERLLLQIAEVPEPWMRVQLARVFRKYVSPATPVEMLKRKRHVGSIIDQFGDSFRPIQEVQSVFLSRPEADETLSAILWEYKDRGKKGYDLTERFFELFLALFPELLLKGPVRAGKDILMRDVFPDYPRPTRPVDFVVYDSNQRDVLAVGLARYDSDRGGAQEDDRTGGYVACADEVLGYARQHSPITKMIFLNDGPGLLLGSMWNDYASLETRWLGKIKVVTLRMIPERITLEWLRE